MSVCNIWRTVKKKIIACNHKTSVCLRKLTRSLIKPAVLSLVLQLFILQQERLSNNSTTTDAVSTLFHPCSDKVHAMNKALEWDYYRILQNVYIYTYTKFSANRVNWSWCFFRTWVYFWSLLTLYFVQPRHVYFCSFASRYIILPKVDEHLSITLICAC